MRAGESRGSGVAVRGSGGRGFQGSVVRCLGVGGPEVWSLGSRGLVTGELGVLGCQGLGIQGLEVQVSRVWSLGVQTIAHQVVCGSRF